MTYILVYYRMQIFDDQVKAKTHQILNKNGFYRLPLHKLTQILQLLGMPLAKQAKNIQQNAIQGLIMLIKKINSQKNIPPNYFNEGETQRISIQIKNYLSVIVKELLEVNKNIGKDTNSQTKLASNPFLDMRYPIFQNPLEYRMNPNNKGIPSQMQERMKMQMHMYYMNMYNFGNLPPSMNQNYYEQQESQQKMPSFQHKISHQNLKMEYKVQEQDDKNQKFLSKINLDIIKNQQNELQLRPYLSQDSEYIYYHNSNKFIKPEANEIQIQTDLSLLYQQIQVYPKSKPKKIKDIAKKWKKFTQKPIIIKIADQAQKKSSEIFDEANKCPVKQDKNYFLILNQNNLIYQDSMSQICELRKKQSQFERIQARIKQQLNNINQYANQLKSCLCKGQKNAKQSFQCLNCKNKFHYACFKYQITYNVQQCPLCKLSSLDPINEVKQIVGTYYVEDIQNHKFEVQLSFGQYEYFLSQKIRNNQIELRCLKLQDSLQNSDIVWPDQVLITVNGKVVSQIPGLSLTSCIKKRRDTAVTITSNIFQGQQYNKVKIGMQAKPLTNQNRNTKHINNSHVYLFGVYYVQKLSIEAIFNKYQSNLKPYPCDFINSLMNIEDNQIQIEKVVCNIYDPYSKILINTPVRGSKCKHGQCFDLKTFISLIYSSKNKYWKCPVCNKQSKKIYLDKQILQIIKRSLEDKLIPNQISFMKDGRILLRLSKQQENQSQSSSQVMQPEKRKVKPISKRKKQQK